jgi:hypothetical protein
MTQGSTLASMSHPAQSGVDITPVVASQKCADGLDQRVPFLSLTELTQAPRQRPRGARTAKPWVGVALQRSTAAPTLHTISIAVGLPGIGPGDVQMDSSNSGPPDRSSTGVLFGQSAILQKAHHVPYPPCRTLAPPPAGTALPQRPPQRPA